MPDAATARKQDARNHDEGPERRARVTREVRARTGIDEAMIGRLVHRFCDRVRADPMLAPVFETGVRVVENGNTS